MPLDRELPLTDSQFKLFQGLIQKEIGLFYPDGRKYHMASGLRERMTDLGLDSFQSYFDYLKKNPDRRQEIRELADELSIGETSFFRNAPQFGALKDHILPEIIEERKNTTRTIRIWSAGCSTGQEPYSVMLLLFEVLPFPETWNISLLATDMSKTALMVARAGIYGEEYMKNIRRHDLKKYFSMRRGNWVASDSLRTRIQFEEHNLITDPYTMPEMRNLDIIFCRNVTIYFHLDNTKKIINRFYDCLNKRGSLFIGHSETLWKISDKFVPHEYARTFIYRKGTTQEPPPVKPFGVIERLAYETRGGERFVGTLGIERAIEARQTVQTVSPAKRAEKTVEPDDSYALGVKAVKNKEYDKALEIFEGFKRGDVHFIDAKTGQATLLANRGRYDEAIPVLEQIITADKLNEWAYYHLGVIYMRKEELKKASEMFEKALYVNPRNIVASYHDAEIYFRTGQMKRARSGFETTLKLLKGLPEDYLIPNSGDLNPSVLSQVCYQRLESLKTQVR